MREVAGIVLVVAAVVIAPAGHFWSSTWWAVSVVLAIVGLVLYYSERTLRRERKDRESDSSGNAGDATTYAPGPLHPGGVRRGSTSSGDSDGDFDGD
jgi:membrane protein implicated in regulation of membrane protease activity